MTAKDLIEILRKYPGDAIVKYEDNEYNRFEEVVSVVYKEGEIRLSEFKSD